MHISSFLTLRIVKEYSFIPLAPLSPKRNPTEAVALKYNWGMDSTKIRLTVVSISIKSEEHMTATPMWIPIIVPFTYCGWKT